MKGERIYKKALAQAYDSPEELTRIYALLERAMKLGNADATFAIASWYYFGKYFQVDYRKAFKFLKIAAEKHHSEACLRLAQCYEKGEGVKSNVVKAFGWYLRGALIGNTECMQEVGRFYWYGLGNVQQNKQIAKIWFEFGGGVPE